MNKVPSVYQNDLQKAWNNTKEGPSAWPLDQTCELH